MSISFNLPDKILAGVNQSYTITSDEGTPSGSVAVGGREIAHRLIPLGAPKDALESTTPVMKYKVTFLLPEDSAGQELSLCFRAGASSTEETQTVTDS